MTDKALATKLADELIYVINNLFGMYITSCVGLEMYSQKLREFIPEKDLDNRFHAGRGNPKLGTAKTNYSTTGRIGIALAERDGVHQNLLACAFLIFLYTYWDTEFRVKYEAALGLKKNGIALDEFGDLRNIRHAVIHNKGILDRDMKVFTSFKVGEELHLIQQVMEDMLHSILDAVCKMHLDQTGEKLHSRDVVFMNP
ncbi:MAG: hypothetical protein H6923_04035 [Alphaproteobacteria bacterium]|nr:hypothetical protein [Alphaproteobacteria bacterium]